MDKNLKVWHIPQVPAPTFEYEVEDLIEAWILLDALAKYDQFQLDHNIKGDYSSTQGLSVWDDDEKEWVGYVASEYLEVDVEDITDLTLEELKAAKDRE